MNNKITKQQIIKIIEKEYNKSFYGKRAEERVFRYELDDTIYTGVRNISSVPENVYFGRYYSYKECITIYAKYIPAKYWPNTFPIIFGETNEDG